MKTGYILALMALSAALLIPSTASAGALAADMSAEGATMPLWLIVVVLVLAGAVLVLAVLLVRTRRQIAQAKIAPPVVPIVAEPVPQVETLLDQATPVEVLPAEAAPAVQVAAPGTTELVEAVAPVEGPMEPPPVVVESPAVPPVQEMPVFVTAPPFAVEAPPYQAAFPSVPQFLEAITTSGKLRRFSINRPSLTIGRAADNDLVIGDEFPAAASVADHHARITLREAYAVVEAVSADTPIFINDQPTGRNILRNGWRVSLGDLDLIFRTAGLGTAPLSEPDSAQLAQAGARVSRPRALPEFAPLPDGAVINNRYIALEAQPGMSSVNTYIVESLEPVLRCMKCGFDANGPRQKSCRNCGALLTDSLPYYPHYRIRESLDEQVFDSERRLIGLSHPHALLPHEAFSESPYGGALRYYIVGPEMPPQLAASIRPPQELPDVLDWMQQLAQGMAYLHNNGVALGPIDLWRIALENQQARWVDFTPCELVPEGERPYRFGREVRALTELAYYLITSHRKYDESVKITPISVNMVFDRILGGLEAPTASQLAAALQAALVEVRRPSSLDLRAGRLSDVGQVRQLNEDSLLTLEIGRVHRSISEPLGLYVVCDGMGGQAAGDVASGLAVQAMAHKALAEVMSDGIAEDARPNWEVWLKSALQEANQTIFGRRRAAGNNMGTTCVAALVHGDEAVIGHAGDSRCYLINDQGIVQITRDHSLVQRLVDMGQLTAEEARTHPQRNVIYKNLGDKPTLEPDIKTQSIAAGDRLLLCSDGLSSMLEDERMRQIVMAADAPQEACRQLIREANQRGGEDNITAILVQLEALD